VCAYHEATQSTKQYGNIKNRNPRQVLKLFSGFQPSKKQFSNSLTPHGCCLWTVITIVVVTEIMCLSRRWRARQVSYRIRNQVSSRSTRFGPLKAGISFQSPSCPKQFSTLFCLQKSVATKPYVEIGRMSNQRKAELIHGVFRIQSFWRGHDEFSPRSGLVPKGTICPDFPRCSNPTDFR
jgi:hypothetical protein